MKNIVKFTAIAVIAILAAVSCAPEAELTSYNWSWYTQQQDPALNTNPAAGSTNPIPQPTFAFAAAAPTHLMVGAPQGHVQEVSVTLPLSADVLRFDNRVIESRLKEFLSFHLFTNPVTPVIGEAVTLGEPIDYTFLRRNLNVVTLRINKEFQATDSYVIAKICGVNFTFGHGLRMDRDGFGRAGEPVYDDFLSPPIPVVGATGAAAPAFLPGNIGWTVTVSDMTSVTFSGTNTTAGPFTNLTVATVNMPFSTAGGGLGGAAEQAQRAAILEPLVSRFSLERRDANTDWTPVNAVIMYHRETNEFRIPSYAPTHGFAYRIVYRGPLIFETTEEFYGVRQRIRVNSSSASGFTSQNNRHDTQLAMGNLWHFFNTNIHTFHNPEPVVTIHSQDHRRRNVVIDVRYPIGVPVEGRTHFLEPVSLDVFRDSFRIAYSPGVHILSTFQNATNIGWIRVEDVQFLRSPQFHADHPDPETTARGFDLIRITLDPSYSSANNHNKYFYVNNNILFSPGTTAPARSFGEVSNWMHGFFALRNVFNAF